MGERLGFGDGNGRRLWGPLPVLTVAAGLLTASCTSGPTSASRTSTTASSSAPSSSTPPAAAGASATTANPVTTASDDSKILVYGDCRSPTLKPAEIVLACADHGWVLTDLRWSAWTPTQATAVGTFVYNDCSPNCAAGHPHSVPDTHVTLTAPVRGAGGQTVWSRLVQSPEPPGYTTGPYHGGPFPLPTRPD